MFCFPSQMIQVIPIEYSTNLRSSCTSRLVCLKYPIFGCPAISLELIVKIVTRKTSLINLFFSFVRYGTIVQGCCYFFACRIMDSLPTSDCKIVLRNDTWECHCWTKWYDFQSLAYICRAQFILKFFRDSSVIWIVVLVLFQSSLTFTFWSL